jgi:hypothetical protein
MEDSLIELIPEGITQGVSLKEAFIVILREKDGKHSVPVLVSRNEYALVAQAFSSKRALSNRLPARILRKFGIRAEAVHLVYSRSMKVSALLTLQRGDEHSSLALGVGEGIAFALENHCPLYALRSQFEAQRSLQSVEGQFSLPIASMPSDLLREALRAAVARDEFELAAALRDQLAAKEKTEQEEARFLENF